MEAVWRPRTTEDQEVERRTGTRDLKLYVCACVAASVRVEPPTWERFKGLSLSQSRAELRLGVRFWMSDTPRAISRSMSTSSASSIWVPTDPINRSLLVTHSGHNLRARVRTATICAMKIAAATAAATITVRGSP